jgi:hypothetical protein
MSHYRQVFEDMPAIVTVPPELRHRRVEVILLPLDETVNGATEQQTDESGWLPGFFEKTAGQWVGDLERGPQGEYPIREEFD